MNICFLSKEYPPLVNGGVGVYIYEMARTLTELGHIVHVITEASDEENETCEEGVCIYRIKPVELPFAFLLRGKLSRTIERLEYSFAVFKKLNAIVKNKRIDIVESTDARAEGLWYYLFHKKPALLIKLHTPESIIFDWNNEPHSFDHSLIKIIEEFWITRAKKLLVISSEMRDILSRYYKFDFHGIAQHSNPINVDLFRPDWGITDDRNDIVLYVGRLEFRKGVHVFVRAIPEILKEFPGAKFYFIGRDCGMKPYLERKIKEFNCAKSIVFLDYVPSKELPVYYQRSRLCVVPSLWDNFPYTCLEAMSCGRPVIASYTGGVSEIIKNGLNGVLVTPGSVKELASEAIRILKNKGLAKELGKAASESIKQRYSRFKIVGKSIEIYQNLNS